jgi:AsmA protein
MKKILKLIAIFFAVLLLVVLAAAAHIAATFDAERIKLEATQAVFAKTGRTLDIDGRLTLKFWPSIGLEVEKVTLSEQNSKQRFAAFDRARLSVRVMPLLSKRVVADNIELDGLNLALVRSKDGKLNIADLLGDDNESSPPPEFDVAGINVSKAQLEWRDEAKGSSLKFADLNLSTGHAVGSKAGLSIKDIKLGSKGKFGADNFELVLDVPEFSRSDDLVAAAKVGIEASLSGAARSGTARLDVSAIEGTPQAFRFGGLLLDVDAKMGDKSLKGRLQTPLALDLAAGTVTLSAISGVLELDMPGLPTRPLKLPLKGNLESEYGKPSVSGRLSTAFDETHVDASLDVFAGTPPNIGFNLDIDKLNVDKYLPPAPAAVAKSPQEAEAPVDLSVLKGINGRGTLRIGDLQLRNIKARNLRVTIKAAGGKVDIAPHSADLYGGSVSGAASIDATGNRVALKQSLVGINVQPLVKDVADKDLVEGRGDVTLDIATRGDTVTAMKKSLSGTTRVVLRDGAIKGINIAQSLRNVKARLGSGDVSQAANAADRTDFSELSASFRITSGVAHNDDLAAKSPFLRLGGSGDIDMGNSRLDYVIKASVVASATGQGGKELDSLKGLTIPVRISGPFEKPAFKLELANLVSDAAKAKVEEKQQEAKQKVEDKLKGQLKGLFGK